MNSSLSCFSPSESGLSFPFSFFCFLFEYGFQRLGGLSYFAGAEKKDERVLVPDLGSLTSVYDRCVLKVCKSLELKVMYQHFIFVFRKC